MSNQSVQEYIAAAKARGAVEVRDDVPGQGFDDSEPIQDPDQLGPDLAARVDELSDRLANAKVPSSADELAQAIREENSGAVRAGRLPFQNDMEQWIPGRVLTLPQFLQMLQLINPSFFVSEHTYLSMRGLGLIIGGEAIYSGVAVQDREIGR